MTRRWEGGSLEPVGARDHARGPEDAPVTLVKYGDYECPYCGELHPVLEELRERAGERVRFVFRHFPLESVQPWPRRRPPLRATSGRCTTSSTRIRTNSGMKISCATRPGSGSTLSCSR